MNRLRLGIVLYLLVSLFAFYIPVYATASPTSVSINPVYVNRHVVETGDMAIYGVYDLNYGGSYPTTDPSNATFIFRLIDTDNVTELGAVLPYPYHENGYNEGAFMFYFDAASAPAWGQNYIIRVSENPAKFTSPVDYNFTISPSAYTSQTTTAANRIEMAGRVISMATAIQSVWVITLIDSSDTGMVLSTYGEAYFRNAMVNLQTMAPSIFSLQIDQPTYTTRTWTTTYETAVGSRYSGTWVQESLNAIGTFTTIKYDVATGIVVVAIMVLIVAANAAVFGSVSSGLIDAAVILLGSTVASFFPMQAYAVIAALCVIYLAAKLVRGLLPT